MRLFELASDTLYLSHTNQSVVLPLPTPTGVAVSTPSRYTGLALSAKPQEQAYTFILFFICFLLLAFAFSSRKVSLLKALVYDIFMLKDRGSLFVEDGIDYNISRFLLVPQALLISSLGIFSLYLHQALGTLSLQHSALLFVGIVALVSLYLGYKWLSYQLFIYVFYSSNERALWNKQAYSLVSFCGLLLFMPVLLHYFVPSLSQFSQILIVGIFILSRLLLIYKAFEIFFNRISRLHYLFLYLCAQEIAPLLLLYKSLEVYFNVLVNSAL